MFLLLLRAPLNKIRGRKNLHLVIISICRLISRRPPFVMPSAPIKNAQVSSNRVPMTTSSRFGSASNLVTTQKEACHCQHPADVEFLKDVYLENMRMRMDMLELENKYLYV